MSMTAQTPAEPAAPNTGRILDYWLGGKHHFAADVGAAQAFDGLYSGFPRVFGTLRKFIGRAVESAAAAGVDQFLVLGSGIPTQRNVHEVVPAAKVLYTDIDRVNVEVGKQILADLGQVDYAYCDAADLSTLDPVDLERVLDPAAPLGVVMVGVSAFLTDETIRQTLARLYDLAAAGSVLVADFDGEALESYPAILGILKEAGEPLYPRNPETIRPLLGRWELTAPGILPVEAWGDPQASPVPADQVFMYGCTCTKTG
jgi:O-methyltransferase involved in polyketide biosynthesis